MPKERKSSSEEEEDGSSSDEGSEASGSEESGRAVDLRRLREKETHKKKVKEKVEAESVESQSSSESVSSAEPGDEASKQPSKQRRVSTAVKISKEKGYHGQWASLVAPEPQGGKLRGVKIKSRLKDLAPSDGKHDPLIAASLLQEEADEKRDKKTRWSNVAKSLNPEELDFIKAYDGCADDKQDAMLTDTESLWPEVFMALLETVGDVSAIQHILVLLDDVFEQNHNRVEVFKKFTEFDWIPFMDLLEHRDDFTKYMTARITTKLACWGERAMDTENLLGFFSWILGRLRDTENPYLPILIRCLQMLLRIDYYRLQFVSANGISSLLTILQYRLSFQTQYQLIFCLWLLTFNSALADKLSKYNIVLILSDILCYAVKEKVIRIILSTFRNLIDKPVEKRISKEHSIGMVQCKVLKCLDVIKEKTYDDPELTENIDFLNVHLRQIVKEVSSFDDYATEVKSGRLQWSPTHRSHIFWTENVMKMNENNYELIRIWVNLLAASHDPLVLAVACNDVGEYVRHYPKGKRIVEELGAKALILGFIKHKDANVQYEAILAIQKIMIHNWEYLNREVINRDNLPAAGDSSQKRGSDDDDEDESEEEDSSEEERRRRKRSKKKKGRRKK